MKWIVDRIEEGYAVVETEESKLFNIPLEAFGEKIIEGNVIILNIDKAEEKSTKEKISNLMDSLFVD